MFFIRKIYEYFKYRLPARKAVAYIFEKSRNIKIVDSNNDRETHSAFKKHKVTLLEENNIKFKSIYRHRLPETLLDLEWTPLEEHQARSGIGDIINYHKYGDLKMKKKLKPVVCGNKHMYLPPSIIMDRELVVKPLKKKVVKKLKKETKKKNIKTIKRKDKVIKKIITEKKGK